EHHAADDADARIWNDDVADYLAGRPAHAVSRFFQHRWNGFKDVPADGGYERQHHHREDEGRRQEAEAVRRAGEKMVEHRERFKKRDQLGLDILLYDGREEEEAPDAVDDARDAGEKLDRDADRTAERHRAKLRQEDGNTDADRHGDEHCNGGRDE